MVSYFDDIGVQSGRVLKKCRLAVTGPMALMAMLFAVRYNWAFSAGGSGDQKYWGFNIGFMYR